MAQETSKIGNSDKSQTAVEWLFNIIKLKADSIPTNTADNRRAKGVYVDCLMLIKEAKQIEKQQTVDVYKHGQTNGYNYRDTGKEYIEVEEYYNQTYKTQAQ